MQKVIDRHMKSNVFSIHSSSKTSDFTSGFVIRHFGQNVCYETVKKPKRTIS